MAIAPRRRAARALAAALCMAAAETSAGAGASAGPDKAAPMPGMRLTFDDEFDRFRPYVGRDGTSSCEPGGTGVWRTLLNRCRRMNVDRFGRNRNGEEQIYVDSAYRGPPDRPFPRGVSVDPFHVADGVLAIEARPTSPALLPSLGARYTSGLITTQYSFSQAHGYFEARLKLPNGKGLWPAFWLLPADGPRPPEIDILEAFTVASDAGAGGPTQIHYTSTAQLVPGTARPVPDTCRGWHDVGVDVTKDFHAYGADVEPEGVTFYFDGRAYAKCPPNAAADRPLYVLVNLAVGGAWPGYPDGSNTWPATLHVDYVRVYQREKVR